MSEASLGRALGTDEPADVFELLSNQRRRYTVRALQDLEPPIEVGDLAEYIAAEENDTTVQALSSEERRRVYTSLQQTHLDRLERAGIVECERNQVEPTDRLEELEFYLEVVPGNDIPWATYYLGLSGLAASVTLAAWVGIYPETVPMLTWPTLITLAFGLSALAHVWARRQQTVNFADLFRQGDS